MTDINDEIVERWQPQGPDVQLCLIDDGLHVIYETADGYAVVVDNTLGLFCYARLEKGALLSSGVPISAPPPAGTAPHLRWAPEFHAETVADEAAPALPISRWINKSPIHIANAGKVGSIQVAVDITHPRIGDLIVMLLPPAGSGVWLHNRQGGDTHNLRATYDSERPPSPVSVLVGQAMQGDWSLAVTDVRVDPPGSRGTVDHWWLMITSAQ